MLDNLNPREKKLAILIAAIAPLFVIGLSFLWFMEKYDSNARTIDDLMTQIEQEENKTAKGVLASQRQRYYRSISLPKRESTTRSVYKNWLADVVQEQFATESAVPIGFKSVGRLDFDRELIANRTLFTLRAKATLAQLLSFLHQFYSADQLHRINSLSIKPLKKQVRGQESVLTGELQLTLDIETLSLPDGPKEITDFPVWNRQITPLEQYENSILARNIFGPANNAPALDKPRTLSFEVVKQDADSKAKQSAAADDDSSEGEVSEPGTEEISEEVASSSPQKQWLFESGKDTRTMRLTATDADEEDLLSFELLESSIDGIQLGEQPATSSVRNVVLTLPSMPPGTYPVKFLVQDSGLPAKTNELEFEFTYTEKKPEVVKPPAPPIALATETYVRGFMSVDGKWKALIHERPTSQTHWLFEGDSIELDEQDWKATSVSRSTIIFEVDGETRSFERDSKLSEPVKNL